MTLLMFCLQTRLLLETSVHLGDEEFRFCLGRLLPFVSGCFCTSPCSPSRICTIRSKSLRLPFFYSSIQHTLLYSSHQRSVTVCVLGQRYDFNRVAVIFFLLELQLQWTADSMQAILSGNLVNLS
jgi:hypothetical protein